MDPKWIILPFFFLMFFVIFISAWFPEWSIKWGNPNIRGRGYPMSAAGKIAPGSTGMLMALFFVVDGIQPRYFRYIEIVVLFVLIVVSMFLAIRDKLD